MRFQAMKRLGNQFKMKTLSIHAESTCLLQGHQVRILTYLYKKNLF